MKVICGCGSVMNCVGNLGFDDTDVDRYVCPACGCSIRIVKEV